MAEQMPVITKSNIIGSELIARKALVDSALQADFEQNGYVVVPRFLDSDTMNELNELYTKFSPAVKMGFHVTNWVKDNDYSAEAHENIRSALSDRLVDVLDKYKPVLGCFAVKETGYDNSMGLHQDWSLTDESQFYGLSVWVPLVDVDEDSGALRVLKGSHRIFRNIRGQKINNQLDDLPSATINKYLTAVPMRAGDMLILHHRLVHCSGGAQHRRVAAMMALIPQEAELKHYMADTNDRSGKKIKAYNCPDDFYIHFDIESPPAHELEMEVTDQTDFVVTEAMIKDYYSK